jgi:hypothetical protein
MRGALLSTIALCVGAAGLLVCPVASASPSSTSAIVTIGQLEAQGFDVRVDRVGSAPLSECEVTDIRSPRDQTKLVRVDGGQGRDRVIEVVVKRTITVSLDCSRR